MTSAADSDASGAAQPAAKKTMRAGGRATEAGMSFQAEVGALFAAQMLTRSAIGQRFGLAHDERITGLRLESGKGVDDVVVALSGGGTRLTRPAALVAERLAA